MYHETKETIQKTLNNSSEKAHEKYKEYRNCLKKLLRKTKQEYYEEKCVEFKRIPEYQKIPENFGILLTPLSPSTMTNQTVLNTLK